jgi:sulfur-carrier protein adenylyltransferase/sulfurtransferase
MLDNLKKMFSPVEALDPVEARDFITGHKEGTYTLLDVRQPGEYETDHIPGATLIPLPQLYDSLSKLDRDKPVIVY